MFKIAKTLDHSLLEKSIRVFLTDPNQTKQSIENALSMLIRSHGPSLRPQLPWTIHREHDQSRQADQEVSVECD